MDLRNNVIFNWIDNGVYGGEAMNVNIVNNYYKPTAGTKTGAKGMRIASINIRTTDYCKNDDGSWNDWYPTWHVWGKYYVDGNVNSMYPEVTNDNWTYGIYNQIDANGNDGTYTAKTKDTIRIDTPITYEAVTTHTAELAYQQVLKYVGASLHRDALDAIIVRDAEKGECTFTASGNANGIIDHPSDVKGDGWEKWPPLNQTEVKTDTDGDGMPDEWETANGLNPGNKSDGNEIGEGGYTNLEIYMNSLVADITAKQNEGGEIWSGQQTVTGITIPQVSCKNQDNAIYTLQGMLVTNPTKGIYIKNGKKVVIK
jgi:hypothetical protein